MYLSTASTHIHMSPNVLVMYASCIVNVRSYDVCIQLGKNHILQFLQQKPFLVTTCTSDSVFNVHYIKERFTN